MADQIGGVSGYPRRFIDNGDGTYSEKVASVSAKAAGQVTWTKGTKTLDGSSQQLVAANAARVGLILFNRIGNAQVDVDIAGGTVAANTGRSITGGNDYFFNGAYCPVGAVTIIGTNTQIVTYWEGV